MKAFEIGNFQVWKSENGYIVIASRDRSKKDETWIWNTLTEEESKRFMENLKELIG